MRSIAKFSFTLKKKRGNAMVPSITSGFLALFAIWVAKGASPVTSSKHLQSDAFIAEETCSQTGAIRHSSSGSISVCLDSGRWLHLEKGYREMLANGSSSTEPDCVGLEGKLLCDNECSTLGVCVNTGQWLQTLDCSEMGQMCLEGWCTDEVKECGTRQFVGCFVDGVFPDLTDCKRYFECNNGSAQSRRCPTGTIFNTCTEKCDIAVSSLEQSQRETTTCSWQKQTPCLQPGTFGTAPHNDRLFYVCVSSEQQGMQILWSRCSLGHFDKTHLHCVDEQEPGCRAAAEGQISTTPSSLTTPTSNTTPSTGACSNVGPLPNPDTNCSYFFCTPTGDLLPIKCNTGFHFELAAGMCVAGECTLG